MSKLRIHLVFTLLFLVPLMNCGGGGVTGKYQLTTSSATQGCTDDFMTFIIVSTGNALQPGNAIVNITESGNNSINVALEGTSLAVICTPTSTDGNVYKGSLTGTQNLSGCMITESMSVTLTDQQDGSIEIRLVDAWANSATVGCPFVSDSCSNSFTFDGNPL